MFIEPNRSLKRKGWIEVICGSMFSGKTEELIRRLKRAQIAAQSIAIFKPVIDTRYDETAIVSHDASKITSIPVNSANEIIALSHNVDVVAVDEAQFFGNDLITVLSDLAHNGVRVIVAGLDMDYKAEPFGPIPGLLAQSEYITKLHAICVKCGDIANYSYRKTADDVQVMIGEKEAYEPRCRSCFKQRQ